jgi:hypothetical protein
MGALRCQADECDEVAVIAGRLCPAHAIGAYRRDVVRPEAKTSFKSRTVAVSPCTAGYGCAFPAVGDELCGRHRRQMTRRGRTTPIAQRRPRGAAMLRDEQGRKQCSVCLTWRPLSDYSASPVQADGLQPRCKGCARFATYRVTPEHYSALLEAQGGVCAVCELPDATGKDLAVDHDHGCCPVPRSCGNCVRGLLCSRCNLGIGRFGDDPDRVQAAVEYLRTWSVRAPRAVPAPPPAPRDNRWYAFKLPPDEYASTLEAQGGGCAVCGSPPGVRALVVDHDRACCTEKSRSCGECVRGLLCTNCNVGISNFDEDASKLASAAAYLREALTRGNAF